MICVHDLTEAAAFYDHLTKHIVAGPRSVAYFVPTIILLAALLIPPSLLSTRQLRSVILPLSLGSFLYHCITDGYFDVLTIDVLLWTITLIAYYDPRRDFRKIHIVFQYKGVARRPPGGRNDDVSTANGTPGKEDKSVESEQSNHWDESYPSNFIDRIFWVLNLSVSLRFHNWKIGELSHDRKQPMPSTSRNAFLRMIVVGSIRSYLVLDTAAYLSKLDPYFRLTELSMLDIGSHPLSEVLVGSHLGFIIVLLRLTIIQAAVYGAVSFYTFYGDTFLVTLASMVIPLSHDWKPWNWPVHFGPFSSVADSGLRGFWGRWWHQYMRNICTPPGRAIADWLNLPPRSQLRYILFSASAFFSSGIVHMGLTPPEPIFAHISALKIRLLWAGFFWLQFPGVIIEAFVSKAANKYFSPSFMSSLTRKTITFIWAWIWLSLTFPFLAEATRQLNYWNVFPVPFSIWSGLLENQWLMWRKSHQHDDLVRHLSSQHS